MLEWIVSNELYLKERPTSLPMVQISTKNENIINEDNWESSTNRDMRFFMNDQNVMFGSTPLWKNSKKQK